MTSDKGSIPYRGGENDRREYKKRSVILPVRIGFKEVLLVGGCLFIDGAVGRKAQMRIWKQGNRKKRMGNMRIYLVRV